MSGESSQDRHVDMRLNHVPMDPGGSGSGSGGFAGGPADFASTPAEKKAAADTIQNELERSTKTATEHADDATGAAQKGFDGWETAAGLKTVADTWDKQAKVLMGRLSWDKTALRGASGEFVRNDVGIGSQFLMPKSKLNDLSRG